MDKPVSLSVKAFLIRKMAVELMIPESTLEIVVNHQFGSALNAMQSNKSVEISGFGKFLFNTKKAFRMMEKYKGQIKMYNNVLLSEDITENRRKNIGLHIETIVENINELKPKLNGLLPDL